MLGRSQPVTRSPDKPSSQTSSGITEHRPNIVRTYSGHFRAFPGISGHEMVIVCRIVPRRITCGQARRVPLWPVAGSRAIRLVACRIARRRIACGSARRTMTSCRVPYRSSPDRVPYGPSSACVSSCFCPYWRPHVPAVPTVGRAEHPSSAMPRPNMAL